MRPSPSRDPQKKKRQHTVQESCEPSIITPREVVRCLDRHIYGQEHAKETIGMICQNIQHRYFFPEIGIPKTNCLIMGPTGTGKTEMLKTLSSYINIPFATLPMTALSPVGYKGGTIDSVFYQLIPDLLSEMTMSEIKALSKEELKAHSYELIDHAIIYLDEIDKIHEHGNTAGFDEGLQDELIGLIEDSPVFGGALSTRDMTFIGTGVFSGLEEIVYRRMTGKGNIGFDKRQAAEGMKENPFAYVTTKDLVEYGMKPELIPRFTQRSYTTSLSVDNLSQILGLNTTVDTMLRDIMLDPESYRGKTITLTGKNIIYRLN